MFRLLKWLRNRWPFVSVLLITFIFFWKFFLRNLLPIPSDIITGTYFPWFDLRFSSFPSGVPVKNNILSDVVSIMYPLRKLAVDQLKQGTVPLWNPYILSGNVLLANFQSVPFYPLNILYWVIPDFAKAWSVEIILQPFLAWLFMYMFLRNNKFSKISSVFGSSAWAFSGFFAVWFEYNTIVQASLYFPLILYSIQKTSHDRKYYLLLSIAISLSFYAGYPQITLYELVFAAIFVFVIKPLEHLRNYFTLLFYVLIGIGLSLPFILPGYEASSLSIRPVDNIANQSNIKFILPVQIVTFVAPDYFGNPTSRNYWLTGGNYENAVVFAGLPAFVLFLSSTLIKKKSKLRLLYYAWLVFLAAATLAFKNPLSQMIGNSNIFLFSASVMGRFAVIVVFAVAVSSAYVLETIIRGEIKLGNILKPLAAVLLLIAGYAFFAYLNGRQVALRNLILPFTIFIASGICILGSIKLKKYKFPFLAALVVLELFDLYHFHDKYNPFSPSEFLYPQTPITDFLSITPPGRFESEDGPIIPANMWMPYYLYSASGQEAVGSLRYNKFLGFVNTGRLQTSDRYAKIVNYDSPLIDFLGITNVAAIKWKNGKPDFEGIPGSKFSNSKYQQVFEDGRSVVLMNTKAYPRAFAVENYVLATTDEEFSKLLSSEDLSKTLILEETPERSFENNGVKIDNVNLYTNSTALNVESAGNSMVVITQSYFPGWKAYIDGVESHLYRADYGFISVPVPPGKHRVELKYQPISFKLGLVGGGISVICLIICYFCIVRKNKI